MVATDGGPRLADVRTEKKKACGMLLAHVRAGGVQDDTGMMVAHCMLLIVSARAKQGLCFPHTLLHARITGSHSQFRGALHGL